MATKKNKGGRPSKYEAIQKRLAEIEKFYIYGLTDKEIADVIDVNPSTIYAYKKEYPEFSNTLKKGKYNADTKVVESLYKRATGFEYEETMQEGKQDSDGNLKVSLIRKTKKFMPPDTAAAFIWLKNRQPDKWKDKQEVVHSGSISDPLVDKLSKLSIDELRKIAGLE